MPPSKVTDINAASAALVDLHDGRSPSDFDIELLALHFARHRERFSPLVAHAQPAPVRPVRTRRLAFSRSY